MSSNAVSYSREPLGAYPKLKKCKEQLLSVSNSDSESDENSLHYPISPNTYVSNGKS